MTRKIFGSCGLALVLALFAASMTKADSVDNFTYTSNGNTFVWQLPASPVPDSGDVYPGMAFFLNNVSVSENGGAGVLTSLGFYSAASAGGFDMTIGNTYVTTGWVPLYSGPESAPTFLQGTFHLTDYGWQLNSSQANTLSDSDPGVPGTLSIVAMPEPSSLVLLIAGSLGLLAITRRRG